MDAKKNVAVGKASPTIAKLVLTSMPKLVLKLAQGIASSSSSLQERMQGCMSVDERRKFTSEVYFALNSPLRSPFQERT